MLTARRFSRVGLARCVLIVSLMINGLIASCVMQEPTAEVVEPPPAGKFEIGLASRRFEPNPMSITELQEWLSHIDQTGQHVILQFNDVLSLRDRREIADAGIQLMTPLPGRAWLCFVPANLSVEQLDLVPIRWIGGLTVDDKVSAALRNGKINEYASRDAGRVELLVKLFPSTSGSAIKAAVEQNGGILIQDAADKLNVAVASLPINKLDDLARFDGIRFIEPTLPTPVFESDRARGYTGVEAAQVTGLDGTGVTVGVIEGGHALTNHADFGARVTKGDSDSLVVVQHPTMTMGMIAGSGSQSISNGGSSLQWRGVAPAVTGKTYNFTDPVSNITNYLGDVQDAIQNDGVDVINNSWGDFGCATFPYGSYAGRAPFLDGAVRGNLGRQVPIVFSAGNERDSNPACTTNNTAPFANYQTLNHPKSAKNIIIVGAVDSANDRMSSYSSWGPTADGRLKPEVVAAAQHNTTNNNGVGVIDNPFGNPIGASNQQQYRVPNHDVSSFVYAWYSQTSSAAAITSGSYALMLEAWRTKFPTRSDPLPSTYKALVVHTARDLDDTTTWYNPGPDYASGYGLVQIDQAVSAINMQRFREADVANGASKAYFLVIPSGTPAVKITLAWDDPEAVENSNPALVNDLDLVVTDPTGVRRFPWTLDPNNPAANAVRTQEDHVNNLEQVMFSNPTAGLWEVTVVGTNVPDGPQAFSIVADDGPVRQPVDLILALDMSSSMNGSPAGGGAVSTKIALLQQSVELFLQIWSLHAVPGDRIGVVYFNSNLSSVPPVPPVLRDLAANLVGVISHVNAINASGCTALGAALQEAFDSFDTTSNNKRAIVLFTDGMQSINPYVGEEGSPARMKIKSFATTDPLPFGAFRCSTGTAQDIAGNPSTPDGLFLDNHDTEIHTIGTGVNGATFVELIERIADETGAVHHFTSSPDTNLDLFFTNDLVQSLKSNTLEIVRTDEGDLSPTQSVAVPFQINETARNVTVALSWKGSLKNASIISVVQKPDGSVAIPDDIKQGLHYSVMRFDRPLSGSSSSSSFTGNWTSTLNSAVSKAVGYQQTVIVDEGCFDYDFASDGGRHFAGDKIRLTARLTEFGRPMSNAKDVFVRVTRPEVSRTNLISKWLPKVHAQHLKASELEAKSGGLRTLTELEKRLRLLKLIPEFQLEMKKTKSWRIQLVDNGDKTKGDWKARDGIYSGYLLNTSTVGSYDLQYLIRTSSACGAVERSQFDGLYVSAERFDRGRTVVSVVPVDNGVAVSVTPADRFGNVMGPGLAGNVHIEMAGRDLSTAVVDNFDGSYTRVLQFKDGGDPIVSIWLGKRKDKPVFKVRLSELSDNYKR